MGKDMGLRAHNPKVGGSNPTPATKKTKRHSHRLCLLVCGYLPLNFLRNRSAFFLVAGRGQARSLWAKESMSSLLLD